MNLENIIAVLLAGAAICVIAHATWKAWGLRNRLIAVGLRYHIAGMSASLEEIRRQRAEGIVMENRLRDALERATRKLAALEGRTP